MWWITPKTFDIIGQSAGNRRGHIHLKPTKPNFTQIRARLRLIPYEIGQAHRTKDIEVSAHLYAERALYLELLESRNGTRELLALAQKEAAEALEKAGDRKGALGFYRKAFDNRGRIISYLVGKENTIKWQGEEIARLRGILASNPDKETRERLVAELRSQGVILPEETLKYEVNAEEVEKIIAQYEKQRRSTRQEADFTLAQLNRVRRDLDMISGKIKFLEAELT